MFATNWALSLASLYIVLSAMKKGKTVWPAFLLHGAIVLVIPSIRKLYLCPVPFGMFLDTGSFLSQLIIHIFCSVTLLCALVVSQETDKELSHAVLKES